jgi:hypothetical protein
LILFSLAPVRAAAQRFVFLPFNDEFAALQAERFHRFIQTKARIIFAQFVRV